MKNIKVYGPFRPDGFNPIRMAFLAGLCLGLSLAMGLDVILG